MRLRVAVVSLIGVAGCGGSLPEPRQSAPPADAFVEVPYPPPAALAELIPPRPAGGDTVYQDGGWTWRGGYYVWQRGGWVKPKPGLRLCPWTLKYLPDGRALFAESRWVDASGSLVRSPRFVVSAATPANEVTAEFQTGR